MWSFPNGMCTEWITELILFTLKLPPKIIEAGVLGIHPGWQYGYNINWLTETDF